MSPSPEAKPSMGATLLFDARRPPFEVKASYARNTFKSPIIQGKTSYGCDTFVRRARTLRPSLEAEPLMRDTPLFDTKVH